MAANKVQKRVMQIVGIIMIIGLVLASVAPALTVFLNK